MLSFLSKAAHRSVSKVAPPHHPPCCDCRHLFIALEGLLCKAFSVASHLGWGRARPHHHLILWHTPPRRALTWKRMKMRKSSWTTLTHSQNLQYATKTEHSVRARPQGVAGSRERGLTRSEHRRSRRFFLPFFRSRPYHPIFSRLTAARNDRDEPRPVFVHRQPF